MRKLIPLLLAALLASCATPPAKAPAPSPAKTRLSLLGTDGARIVDASGREVRLRGVNVGSWLVVEPWMLKLDGQPGIECEKDIWDTIGKRFGRDAKLDVIRAHRASWFTEKDAERIAALGLNCVRVPVWWRSVTDPEYGGGFEWLDHAVRWCAANGLYVIIDLHGAPGGQSAESRILGERCDSGLWKDERSREATIAWWSRIAERFRDEPAVAGYDLLNEAYGAQMDELVAYYDRLYKAIREKDPRHLVILEDGLQGFHRFPRASDMGWSNVVYSFHYYPPGPLEGVTAPAVDFYKYHRMSRGHGVPTFVGEFNSMQVQRGGVTAFRRYVDVFDYYGWSWAFWTYKNFERNRDYNWGVYGARHDAPPVDLGRATLDEIRAYFASGRTEDCNLDPAMEAAIRAPNRWESEPLPPVPEGARRLLPRDGYLLAAKDDQLQMEWGTPVPNAGFWGTGDSFAWTVDCEKAGTFELGMRCANSSAASQARVWLDGVQAADVSLKNSGGWSQYTNQALTALALSAGRHSIEISQADANGGFANLQCAWLRESAGAKPAAEAKAMWLKPTNLDPLPKGSPIRVEWWRNPPNIGYWKSGEEASWTVRLPAAGQYQGALAYAMTNTDARLAVFLDRQPMYDGRPAPTGDWHKYEDVSLGLLKLPAGEHTLSVLWETGNPEGAANVRALRFERK